ncbi:MAG: hypothetical protein CMM77_12170 [Rhodospirillaceae bacterium]|nr:hypothetical protein [Magnetovibrio sp.]MAY67873.1 hypothetical protein [Rhodospirillaceae bacterium]
MRYAGAMAVIWIVLGGPALQADAPAVRFAESSVVVHTASGAHPFKVEMALDDAQRALGLMYRRALDPDRGMLFDFGREIYISMWMRNTFIPLDMLFIGADGRIGFIRERTTPQSLEIIEAPDRNRAVLEVAAGTVARLGIRVGDRVDHAIFR